MNKLFIIVLIIFSTSNFSNAEILKIGTDGDYPNFIYKGGGDGEYYGAEVDLANELCDKKINNMYECERVILKFDSLISALKNGEIDIILSAMNITEERKREIDFSIPYFVVDGQGIGIGIRKNQTDLKSKINKAISEMISDGFIKEISLNSFYEDYTPY
jgi:ABC-type amino acid transport substrate-binding protein